MRTVKKDTDKKEIKVEGGTRMKKRKWLRLGVTTLVLIVMSLTGFSVGLTDVTSPSMRTMGDVVVVKMETQKTITIGLAGHVSAGTSVDYTATGVNDDVVFQTALNALPATGGEIVVISSGAFSFSSTVLRAIDNVTIYGTGEGTLFNYDGASAIFDAGTQDGWVFGDFATDAGGLDVGTATHWTMRNINVGGALYAYDTSSDITSTYWDIPTGRGATFTVAANDSSAGSKAQADYVADGVNDQVEIQAALNAAESAGGGVVQLMESFAGFAITSITIPNGVTLQGVGGGYLDYGTRISPTGSIFMTDQAMLKDMFIGVAPAYANDAVVYSGLAGAGLSLEVIDNVTFYCATQTGTAFLIDVVTTAGDNNSIVLNRFGKIYIVGFDYGVEIESDETAGNQAIFTYNTFEYIATWGTDHPIFFNHTSGDVGANIFENVQMQDSAINHSTDGVTLYGDNTRFLNLNGADFLVETLIIPSTSANTYAYGIMPLVTDEGTDSRIYKVAQYDDFNYAPPLGITEFYNADGVWAWNEMGGLISNDLSDKGNLATLIDFPGWSVQGQGYKLTLDGANDYIEISDNIDVTGSRTIMAVVSPDFDWDANINVYFFGCEMADANYFYVSKSNNAAGNKIWANWQSGGGGLDSAGVTAHFVTGDVLVLAITYNDVTKDFKVYVNGKMTAEKAGADTQAGAIADWNIGADWDGNNKMDAWFGAFINLPVALNDSQIVKMTNLLGDLYDGQIVTANHGTGTITNPATSDVITHGLSLIPDVGRIVIVPTENPTADVGTIWVDTVTSTQFTVNSEVAPGASHLDFSWSYQQ